MTNYNERRSINYTIPILFPGIPKIIGLVFDYDGDKYTVLSFSPNGDLYSSEEYVRYRDRSGQFLACRWPELKATHEVYLYHKPVSVLTQVVVLEHMREAQVDPSAHMLRLKVDSL